MEVGAAPGPGHQRLRLKGYRVRSFMVAVALAAGAALAATAQSLDPDGFTNRVLALCVQKYPGKGFARAGTLLLKSRDRQVSLANLYRAVTSGDTTSDGVIKKFVDGIYADTGLRKIVSFKKAESLLRPQLARRDYLSSLKGDFLYERCSFCDDLIVAYVIDEPDRFSYASKRDLDQWNVDLPRVRATAEHNLDAGLDAVSIEPGTSEGKVAYVTIVARDGYAASRMLLPSVRGKVEKMLSGPYLFAVPNRNFAVCWREDYSHSEEFKEQVRKDVSRRPHPLTDRIFHFDGTKVSSAKR